MTKALLFSVCIYAVSMGGAVFAANGSYDFDFEDTGKVGSGFERARRSEESIRKEARERAITKYLYDNPIPDVEERRIDLMSRIEEGMAKLASLRRGLLMAGVRYPERDKRYIKAKELVERDKQRLKELDDAIIDCVNNKRFGNVARAFILTDEEKAMADAAKGNLDFSRQRSQKEAERLFEEVYR